MWLSNTSGDHCCSRYAVTENWGWLYEAFASMSQDLLLCCLIVLLSVVWINLWNLSDKMEMSGMLLLKSLICFCLGGTKYVCCEMYWLFVCLAGRFFFFFIYIKRKETGESCVQFFYVEHNYLSIKFHYTCLKLVGEKRTNVQSI